MTADLIYAQPSSTARAMSATAKPKDLFSRGGGPLVGGGAAPGDKSISHRALILGSMAGGETRVVGLLESDDVLRTAAAVRAFGATAIREAPGTWIIRGTQWRSPPQPIDCGNAGTAVRLLMGAAAGFPLTATFDGDYSLRRRPMARVIEPLTKMGARIAGGPLLPVTVSGGGLQGISFRSPRPSAQVKSAVLLAGLRAKGAVEVFEAAPSRDHTERMLRAFGVDVDIEDVDAGRRVRLSGSRDLRGTNVEVPGDPSSAAFLLVAALITQGSDVTIRNVLANPLRTGLFDVLRSMGADLALSNPRELGGESVADLTARSSALTGVEVPAALAPRMIDEYPILAVAAACASGTTVMHGLAELRVKESDRLAGIVAGLQMCGVRAEADGDRLIVEGCGGPPPGGARVSSHGDHRLAMAFLVLGLAAQRPVEVDQAAMIDTSFPGFASLMRALGARIEPR
jgi:3-phosphoshikimate 1-carboxyvinyltransferase